MTNAKWLAPLLLALASVGIVAFVLARLATGGGSSNAGNVDIVGESSSASSAGTVTPSETSTFDRFPAADFAPRPSEAQMASRSQLIVVGQLTEKIGSELIPPSGEESVTPDASEPVQGVATTKYTLKVEKYVKGKGPDALTLQVVDGFGSIPMDARFLFFLVPYRPATYQADIWSTVEGAAGKPAFLSGDPVEQVAATSLDEYADHVSAIVQAQAAGTPVAGLAVPAVLPDETIIPAQLLGLQNTKEIQLTESGKAPVSLSDKDVASLIEWASQPMRVQKASIPAGVATVQVTILLDDGHVWEFEYDPNSGVLAYRPAGLQVTLPESARAIVTSALVATR